MLAKIFQYVQLAMAGAVIVEQTFQQDTGASKKQKALDIINNEAQLVGAALPGPITSSIVNMVVAGYNLAGLFTHKNPASK